MDRSWGGSFASLCSSDLFNEHEIREVTQKWYKLAVCQCASIRYSPRRSTSSHSSPPLSHHLALDPEQWLTGTPPLRSLATHVCPFLFCQENSLFTIAQRLSQTSYIFSLVFTCEHLLYSTLVHAQRSYTNSVGNFVCPSNSMSPS